MSLSLPDRGRTLPVRLCDLRPEVLQHAARLAARNETDPDAAFALLNAALRPSDRVFYVSDTARDLLDEIAA